MILLIVLFFPYIKAEYLTAKYRDEFDDGYEQTGMINGIENFRVVEYNDIKAGTVFGQKRALRIIFVGHITDNQ